MSLRCRGWLLLILLLVPASAGCSRRESPAVVLRFAHGGWLQKLQEDPLPVFAEAHPEIQVSQVTERTVADVLVLDGFDLAAAIHAKQLFNLLPLMETEHFDLRQFKNADIRQGGRVDGFYGLPIGGGGPAVIYFNADLFEKHDILLPDKRWEWCDFLDAARKLTEDLDKDGTPDRYGFLVESKIEALLPWLWQAGGLLVKYDDPKAVKGIEFYADLVRKHHVSPPPNAPSNGSPVERFAAQKLAMFLGGFECASKLGEAGFKWNIQTPPRGPAGCATTVRQFFCAVSANTTRPDQAWTFVKFLCSAYVGVGVARSDLMPARAELLRDFQCDGYEVTFNHIVWGRAYDMANHVPFLPAYDERHDGRISHQLIKLLEGNASPDETAQVIAETTAAIRKRIE